MKVGDGHYERIDGLPGCEQPGCSKRVSRVGGVVDSAFCRSHYRVALDHLMDDGVPFHIARQTLWEARPRVRLTFVGRH
jgi:hypothetical protein